MNFTLQAKLTNKIFPGIDANATSYPHIIAQTGRLVFIASFIAGFKQGVAKSHRAVGPNLLLVRAAKVQGRGKLLQNRAIDWCSVGIENSYKAAH